MAQHPTLLTPCLNADGPAPAASSSAPVLGAGQGTSSAFVSPRYITLATPPIPEPIPALPSARHFERRAGFFSAQIICHGFVRKAVFSFTSPSFAAS